jgi:DNA-3-methyladenine glycosylase II
MTPEAGPGAGAEDPWNSPRDEPVWPEATRRLSRDPGFGALVARTGPVRLPPPDAAPFEALARAIAFQQLAGKAASTIWGRVLALLEGAPTPDAFDAVPDDALRGAGLSGAKRAAIRDLSARVARGELPLDRLHDLSDEEVVETLTRVRGIGPWTAQMHLIFQLRRPDVWPVGDLGVRAGWARIHGLPEPPDPRALASQADHLRPWRSAVAWYCWRVVDLGLEVP